MVHKASNAFSIFSKGGDKGCEHYDAGLYEEFADLPYSSQVLFSVLVAEGEAAGEAVALVIPI